MGWIRVNAAGVWEVDPKKQMGRYTPSQLRWNMGYRNAIGHLQYAKNPSLTLREIPGVSRGPQRKYSLVLGTVATHP